MEAIGRILASAGPTDEVLDRVVASITTELGYQHVSIYLGDESLVAQVDAVEHPDGQRAGRIAQRDEAFPWQDGHFSGLPE